MSNSIFNADVMERFIAVKGLRRADNAQELNRAVEEAADEIIRTVIDAALGEPDTEQCVSLFQHKVSYGLPVVFYKALEKLDDEYHEALMRVWIVVDCSEEGAYYLRADGTLHYRTGRDVRLGSTPEWLLNYA